MRLQRKAIRAMAERDPSALRGRSNRRGGDDDGTRFPDIVRALREFEHPAPRPEFVDDLRHRLLEADAGGSAGEPDPHGA